MIETVQVRQRGAYDFGTYYDNLCALQNTVPLPAVKAHLSDGVLDLNSDRLRGPDFVPLLNTLRINKSLSFVAFRSYYQPLPSDTPVGKRYLFKKRAPPVRTKDMTLRICKALRECLTVTPSLTCVEVTNLPLRNRDLENLAKGIAKNTTMTHLSLEYCRIGDDGLEVVCQAVKNSATITSVNFTGCGLTARGADTLAKIIKHQAMKRHNEAWQDSLRYRRPDLDRMTGIRRITMNSNPMMDDLGAMALAEALKDDLWVKALDLQQCGISTEGAKALYDVLRTNTTIVVLDLRRNPLIDRSMMQSIMEQVMINTGGQDTEYRWIKVESPRDPGKASYRPPPRRRRRRTVSSGRKTFTVEPQGRKRSRSVGSVEEESQPYMPDNTQPGTQGFVPWRTAARLGRYRGFPPEKRPGTPSVVAQEERLSPVPGLSPQVVVESESESSSSSRLEPETLVGRSEKEDDILGDKPVEPEVHRRLEVELEDCKRRLTQETRARSESDRRLLELQIENSRLRREVNDLRERERRSLLEDDRVLESIEATFQRFYSFLDLLKESGLGDLASLAGIDQSQLNLESMRFQPRATVHAPTTTSYATQPSSFAATGMYESDRRAGYLPHSDYSRDVDISEDFGAPSPAPIHIGQPEPSSHQEETEEMPAVEPTGPPQTLAAPQPVTVEEIKEPISTPLTEDFGRGDAPSPPPDFRPAEVRSNHSRSGSERSRTSSKSSGSRKKRSAAQTFAKNSEEEPKSEKSEKSVKSQASSIKTQSVKSDKSGTFTKSKSPASADSSIQEMLSLSEGGDPVSESPEPLQVLTSPPAIDIGTGSESSF
ncbi:CEP78 [Branchiostoma lanceolatum]|uniref:CEP78 protein n=1 Tax=Branchiostoma lanceolatum TaxID=7740 RepID=A0A8J9ZBA9_BRALA|nr:CEP78 [Branchiostoma lanceolatum]